mgnify:FL=1
MNLSGLEYLHSLAPLGMTGDLKNMERLLNYFDHPEKMFRTIHVVGTDGKGSTSFYLANILTAHGVPAGLYTSPHLVNVRERIRIDNIPIAESDFDRLLLQVKKASELTDTHVSFFEAVTLACFLYFAEKRVGAAVIEAGLGGRLDSTRVARGELAVLTSIGLEHTELLGKTEPAILHEKLGVLSPHAKILVGGISETLVRDACEFVKTISAELQKPCVVENLQVPNPGRHYVENASLSFAAAKEFLGEIFSEKIAREALQKSLWIGRMQKLLDSDGKFLWLLDGAHNPHAVKRLAEALETYYPHQKFPCVFGALKDKAIDEMIPMMAPHVSTWHVTRTPYERFREIEDVTAELNSLGCTIGISAPMSRTFLDAVQSNAKLPVLVTGSLYMIGEVIDLLKDDFEDLKFFRGLKKSESEKH